MSRWVDHRTPALSRRRPYLLERREGETAHGHPDGASGLREERSDRSVSLNSVVLTALNRLPKLSEFVFAKPGWKPYHAIRGFRAACQRAALKGVAPHSTRHTFATRLCENGVDLRLVQELGGWATLALVQRYAHGPEGGGGRGTREKFYYRIYYTGDPANWKCCLSA